jgi:branched-chain amino acid transport system permease protein
MPIDVLLSGQLLVSTLVLASIYALVALGLNLIYGTMRLLNVAHGEVMMLGGYLAFWSFTLLGIGPLVSMFAAMALGAGLGALCYIALFRRLLRARRFMDRLESNSLLIFFGLSVIVQNLAALAFTPNQRSYEYLTDIVHVGSVAVEADRLAVLAIGIAATAGCVLFFRLSTMGLAVRALIQQRDAASIVGIDADRVNLFVFCLGFAMAGLAGALVSMMQDITPYVGFPFTIAAFVVIILGGLGNLVGGVLGAVLLALVEIYGSAATSTAYRSILIYGVFIAVLFLRPQGLLGRSTA